MKKKIVALTLVLMTVLGSFAGCGTENHIDVKADGTVKETSYYYYTDEDIKSGMSKNESNGKYVGKKTYNGVEYSVYKAKGNDTDKELVQRMKPNGFYYTYVNEVDSQSKALANSLSPCIFTVTFPNKVTETNGTISEDGKSVTFDLTKFFNADEMYAYNEDYVKTKQAELIGIDRVYTNKKTLKIHGFSEIKGVELNGKDLGVTDTVTFHKGLNTVRITNEACTVKRFVRVDTDKPVLNVKDKKTYKRNKVLKVKDKYSGIKEATVNGVALNKKQIKKGYKLTSIGETRIVVTDKAGNTKTVIITVK